MTSQNSILCTVCNGRDFELANGFYYCQTENCGTESRAHGQDFVYEKTCQPFAEPSEVCEDSDSNAENHWKNDYPSENLSESDNEELTDYEELLILEKSYSNSDGEQTNFDLEIDEESQDEAQAGS